MNPINFPEATVKFNAPVSMSEEQCSSINAYVGTIVDGNCKGMLQIITAWMPTEEEIQSMKDGNPVFISFLGVALPPHFLSTTFKEATMST